MLKGVMESSERLATQLELAGTRGQAEDVVAADEASASARLCVLEVELWVELDAFVRMWREAASLRGRRLTTVAVPPAILSLLPPAPSDGWPDGFALETAAIEQRSRAASQQSMLLFNPNFAEEEPEPYYPACESGDVYPVRRRAQRLSFAIWPTISRDDRELQMALEATSTAERLRLAVVRLRELQDEIV